MHETPLALVDALPDLVLLVRRDGILLSYAGGCNVQPLRPASGSEGKSLESLWPAEVAELFKQLTRRAIGNREATEAEFTDNRLHYKARATPQAPARPICVIRPALPANSDHSPTPRDNIPATHLDRRGFLRGL